MNFFQNFNENTLNKLKEEKNEFEKSKNSTMKSKNSNINKSKNSTMKSKISYSSNDSILKIYQSNFIQTIKFKNIPIDNNENENVIIVDDINNNIKNIKNQSKKVSITETNVTSKKIFTPPSFNDTDENIQNNKD